MASANGPHAGTRRSNGCRSIKKGQVSEDKAAEVGGRKYACKHP